MTSICKQLHQRKLENEKIEGIIFKETEQISSREHIVNLEMQFAIINKKLKEPGVQFLSCGASQMQWRDKIKEFHLFKS
jgi:hypothetical protein